MRCITCGGVITHICAHTQWAYSQVHTHCTCAHVITWYTARTHGGLMVTHMVHTVWLFSYSTQVSQYILGHNSRTLMSYQCTLRSVQHTLHMHRCLPTQGQYNCFVFTTVTLHTHYTLLGELFFEAHGHTLTRQLLCILFATHKSQCCHWVTHTCPL